MAGPNVMLGYWNRPDATAEVMDGEWFRSGDVAVVDDEGYVTIVDRMKDMIISGGENIYPAEVEDALYSHPGVAECAVIGVPDERWGEVGRAIVVPRQGRRPRASTRPCSTTSQAGWHATRCAVGGLRRQPAAQRAGKVLKQPLRDAFGDTS